MERTDPGVMFGMGTALSLGDFWGVVEMPNRVLVGLVCQFTIMPFVGWGWRRCSDSRLNRGGRLLIGSAPSG